MSRPVYPNPLHIAAYLENAGFTVGDGMVDGADEAGVAEFERRVGRRMLAEEQTRHFDPPVNRDGYLDLKGDLASLTSITYQGTTLVDGTDFWLLPGNAAEDGHPYTGVHFRYRFWSLPVVAGQQRSLSVAGLWGFAVEIPDDAWRGMLACALLEVYPLLTNQVTGGLQTMSEADLRMDFGNKPLDFLRASWESTRDAAVKRYRRYTL